jgi:hypothetical protein
VIVYKVIDQPNPLTILIAVLAAFQVYASIVREKTDSLLRNHPDATRRNCRALFRWSFSWDTRR